MRLIIGGAYQGKLDFAIKNYHINTTEIVNGEELDISDLSNIKCINNYHLLVKKFLENCENPILETNKIISENPDILIIIDEIGNGIIPLERSERIWREQVGKVGCLLAEKADTVERITCGIAVKIKG